MKKTIGLLVVTVLAVMVVASGPTKSQGSKSKLLRNANKIANHYIVVLDDAVVGEKGMYSAPYIDMVARHGGKI